MKQAIILSIAGLTISSTLSYGGGTIPFDTYEADNFNGIITTYGDGPKVGLGLDNTFTGVLLFSVNPIVEAATTSPASASNPLDPAWSVASTGTFAGSIPDGFILAPNFNYSGSQTTLYFEVAAYDGSSYDTSLVRGHSAAFTANLVSGVTLPTADQLDNMQPFQVFSIPEPMAIYLLGFALSLCCFARNRI